MPRAENKLRARACGEWAGESLQRLAEFTAGAARLIEGDLAALDEVARNLPILIVVEEFLLKDPQAWIAYALDRAHQGQLLGSAGQAVEWYVVTHKTSCSGQRTTTKRSAQVAARGLGAALAAPSLVALNPGLSPAALEQWGDDLHGQGLRGLSPILGSIMDGFQNGAQAWRAAGNKTVATSLAGLRGRLGDLKRRKQEQKFGGPSAKKPSQLVAVAAGAGVGFVVAGPPGAVVGGFLGAVIGEKDSG